MPDPSGYAVETSLIEFITGELPIAPSYTSLFSPVPTIELLYYVSTCFMKVFSAIEPYKIIPPASEDRVNPTNH